MPFLRYNFSSIHYCESKYMIYYTDFETKRVKFYNRFLRSSRLMARSFRRGSGYERSKYFTSAMVPYSTVAEGDTVIQVGSTTLHHIGLSQPLIYSSLVGPKGHVFVVEPDPVGLDGLIRYTNASGVSNVRAIDKAAWNEKGVEKFVYHIGHGGTNVQADYYPHDVRKPSRTPGVLIRERDTEMDTLDNMIRDHVIKKVDHVNITVNGTEYKVLQGLKETLGSMKSVSFVYQNRYTVDSPILSFLESCGLEILIKHAPVFPNQGQFLVGVAAPDIAKLLPVMIDRAYKARFEYSQERRLIDVIRN